MAEYSRAQLVEALRRADAAGDTAAATAIARRLQGMTTAPAAAATPAMVPEEPVTGVLDTGPAPTPASRLMSMLPIAGPALTAATGGRSIEQQMNALRTLFEGVGSGAMETKRAVQQFFTPKPQQDIAGLVSGKAPVDKIQREIDEAARLDAPLLATPEGAAGKTLEQLFEMYLGGKAIGAVGKGAKLLPGGAKVAQGVSNVMNKPGAGLLRRMVTEGARGGAAMGAYEATRPVTSDESRVGNVVSATGQGAAFQGLLGPVVGTLGKKGIEWMRGKMNAGKVSFAQALAELEKMGVRNVNQTALGKAVSLINSGKTDDLAQALRITEAQLDNIPLRQAQALGDEAALARDRMLSKQSLAPEDAALVRTQWANQQAALDEARKRGIENVLPGAEEAQRIGPNLGREVQEPLLAAEAAARKKYKDLYDQVDSDPSARISEIAFNARDKATGKSAQDRFMEVASKMGRQTRDTIPKTSGYAERLLELTKPGGGPLALKEFESIRKSLGKMSTGNDAEAVFAAELKSVLDDTLDKAVDRGLVKSSTLPNIVDMLKQARAAKRQHTVDFRGDDIISRIVGKKWRSGEVDTPMMDTGRVADSLFGAAGKEGKGFTFAPNFEKDMTLLKRRLGAQSESWKAVRAEALNRLVSRAITEDSKMVGRFLQENQRRLSKVLEPGDLEVLHRLSRQKGVIAGAQKGLSPSGEDIQSMSRGITSLLMGGLPIMGAAVGTGQEGSMDNVLMGAALAGGSRFARVLKGRKYSREIAAGATPTPTRKPQVEPKAPLLPMMGLLDYLRNTNSQ